VAVLHDLALAAHFFPRLVVLDRGRIVADGPPSRALGPAIVRTVFGVDPALIARGSAEGASAEGGNGDGPAADVDPRFTPR
jgi:ABC-type hemin transport system ATPase subunit